MTRPLAIIIGLALAAMAYALLMYATPARAAAYPTVTCHSPGVVDGDTLRCNGERIRIWGVQAPERADPAGPASTRAMAALVRGRSVRCEGRDIDRYRRLVARCFVGSVDLAAEMVGTGHAKDWPRYSRGFYGRAR
jgi:endonuclease YncB( thermonuclease family)